MIDIIGIGLETLNLKNKKKGQDDIDLWAENLGKVIKIVKQLTPKKIQSRKHPVQIGTIR